jgi:hypothetical protein
MHYSPVTSSYVSPHSTPPNTTNPTLFTLLTDFRSNTLDLKTKPVRVRPPLTIFIKRRMPPPDSENHRAPTSSAREFFFFCQDKPPVSKPTPPIANRAQAVVFCSSAAPTLLVLPIKHPRIPSVPMPPNDQLPFRRSARRCVSSHAEVT